MFLAVEQIDNIEELMDQQLAVKILEIDEERDRLVFSARRAANDKDAKAYNVSSACK